MQDSLGHRFVFAPPTQYHAFGIDVRVLVIQLAVTVGITGLAIDAIWITTRLLRRDTEHRSPG